jgi:hypothetical protein
VKPDSTPSLGDYRKFLQVLLKFRKFLEQTNFQFFQKDSEFGTVNGFDIDEPNTDNSRIEYAITTISGVFPTPNPPNQIFRIETNDNVGILKADVDMDGFFGDYWTEVTVS